MKAIYSNINWLFLLMVALFIVSSPAWHKSVTNDYFAEAKDANRLATIRHTIDSLKNSKDTADSIQAKQWEQLLRPLPENILYSFPYDSMNIDLAELGLDRFSHLIIRHLNDRGHDFQAENRLYYQQLLDYQTKEDYDGKSRKKLKRQLEGKELLVHIRSDEFQVDKVEKILIFLDSLHKYYPDSELGLVVERMESLNTSWNVEEDKMKKILKLQNFVQNLKPNDKPFYLLSPPDSTMKAAYKSYIKLDSIIGLKEGGMSLQELYNRCKKSANAEDSLTLKSGDTFPVKEVAEDYRELEAFYRTAAEKSFILRKDSFSDAYDEYTELYKSHVRSNKGVEQFFLHDVTTWMPSEPLSNTLDSFSNELLKNLRIIKRLSSSRPYAVSLYPSIYLRPGTNSLNPSDLKTTLNLLESKLKEDDLLRPVLGGLIFRTWMVGDKAFGPAHKARLLSSIPILQEHFKLAGQDGSLLPVIPCLTQFPVAINGDIQKWGEYAEKIKANRFYPVDTLIKRGMINSVMYEIHEDTIQKLIYETPNTLAVALFHYRFKEDQAKAPLGLGIWGVIEPVVPQYSPDDPAGKDGSPLAGELKQIRGNIFKKAIKGKLNTLFYTKKYLPADNPTIDPTRPEQWYRKYYDNGTSSAPDYLLFLLAPFFALKIVLSLFSLVYFRIISPNYRDLYFKKPDQLLGWVSIDLLVWIVIFFLFCSTSQTAVAGCTFRKAAILLLLLWTLKPVLKLLYRLVMLQQKPIQGSSFFRKILKLLRPLTELIYRTPTVDQQEIIVVNLQAKDPQRDIYSIDQLNDLKNKTDEKKEEYIRELYLRAIDFFSFEPYRDPTADQDKSGGSTGGQKTHLNYQGKGALTGAREGTPSSNTDGTAGGNADGNGVGNIDGNTADNTDRNADGNAIDAPQKQEEQGEDEKKTWKHRSGGWQRWLPQLLLIPLSLAFLLIPHGTIGILNAEIWAKEEMRAMAVIFVLIVTLNVCYFHFMFARYILNKIAVLS